MGRVTLNENFFSAASFLFVFFFFSQFEEIVFRCVLNFIKSTLRQIMFLKWCTIGVLENRVWFAAMNVAKSDRVTVLHVTR